MKARTFSFRAIGALAPLAIAGSSLASPEYTAINGPPGGERSHTTILGDIYGGSWAVTGAAGIDRGNGHMSANRVADSGMGTVLSLASSSSLDAEDAVFSGQTVVVSARARYAADSHQFGWIDDTLAMPVFQPLLSTTTGGQPLAVTLSSSFRWALLDQTTGSLLTSRPSDNHGAGSASNQRFDQLTTYHVVGKSDVQNEWVLFWEDRVTGQNADYDYNDAVITVSLVNVVPSPGAAALTGLGLITLNSRRRRR